jgi:hypothetical protein
MRPVRDMSGGCSASDGLQAVQGIPAPPHWQASARSEKKPHGGSGCASHTQPVSSQTGHLAVAVIAWSAGRRRAAVLGVWAPARSLDLPPEQLTEWIELLVKILRAIVSKIEGGRSSRQRRRMACQSTPVIPAGSPCSAGARLHSERTVPPLTRSREIGGYRARLR